MSSWSVFNRVRNSQVAINTAKVASGTAAAQAIALSLSPIVTRIYGPSEYGLFGVFAATAALFLPLAGLTYPIAIVIAPSDTEAKRLTAVSIWISVLAAIAVFFALMLFSEHVARAAGFTGESWLLIVGLPTAVLGAGVLSIASQWVLRTKDFGSLARRSIVSAVVLGTAKISIGLIAPVATVLISVAALAGFMQTLLLVRGRTPAIAREMWRVLRSTSLQRGMAVVSKYRDFPIYRAPQNVISIASQSLPVLALAYQFGPVSAGCYAIAKAAVAAPSTLIANAAGSVLYPKVTEIILARQIVGPILLKGTLILSAIAIVPFVIIALTSEWLFPVIFGAEWAKAGVYAGLLAFYFFFHFVNRPCVVAIPALGIQRGLLVYEVVTTLLKVAALFVGGAAASGSDVLSVALYSIVGGLCYLALIIWVSLVARLRDASLREIGVGS